MSWSTSSSSWWSSEPGRSGTRQRHRRGQPAHEPTRHLPRAVDQHRVAGERVRRLEAGVAVGDHRVQDLRVRVVDHARAGHDEGHVRPGRIGLHPGVDRVAELLALVDDGDALVDGRGRVGEHPERLHRADDRIGRVPSVGRRGDVGGGRPPRPPHWMLAAWLNSQRPAADRRHCPSSCSATPVSGVRTTLDGTPA